MGTKEQVLRLCVAVALLSFPGKVDSREKAEAVAAKVEITDDLPRVALWRDPGDISRRDLFYGAGGKSRQPRGKFTFVKEDMGGSQPKFIVRDEDGTKWKVKLGEEARPETAATRFIWAVGYFTDEDYIVPLLRVANMPRLHRGRHKVAPDGSMRNARFERHFNDAKKIGQWRWLRNPLTGTRELNGLSVMMALVNNWDLKESNTSVYAMKDGAAPMYVVSDLGATFGTTGLTIPDRKSNLDTFMRSKFITKVTPEYLNFATPSRPPLITVFHLPYFIGHIQMRSIGRHIPREDARWIARLLARLSPRQIRSAFQGAGYSPAEVEGFGQVIQNRIAQLHAASN
jgi:hypothetical protein